MINKMGLAGFNAIPVDSAEATTCPPERGLKRGVRTVSEREIAIALVLEFAESGLYCFALRGFYDDDADFLSGLADRLNVAFDMAFHNKLTRVTRHLVRYNVLFASMRGTNKEYLGEPAKQMEYKLKPGKSNLLTRGKSEHTGSPEWEAGFLLRNAYPRSDDNE